MRKIDNDAYRAFINKERFSRSNTRVELDGPYDVNMYLFGNKIAKMEGDDVYISSGGYKPTVTTRSRLSMFVNISIYKGKFIINNKYEWDGNWTNINEFN